MNFFDEWKACIDENECDSYYINSFLVKSSYSTDSLENSNESEMTEIIDFLVHYDRNRIIEFIDDMHIKRINSKDIAQFSSFETATGELTNILFYEKNGLSFEEIGYSLMNSSKKTAATKYGENHSKTARDLNLVKFSKTRPVIVTNTCLGDRFSFLKDYEKRSLLSILALRDSLVLNIIAKSKKGEVEYIKEVECLSESTSIRRRTNVKCLLSYAISGIDREFLKNII